MPNSINPGTCIQQCKVEVLMCTLYFSCPFWCHPSLPLITPSKSACLTPSTTTSEHTTDVSLGPHFLLPISAQSNLLLSYPLFGCIPSFIFIRRARTCSIRSNGVRLVKFDTFLQISLIVKHCFLNTCLIEQLTLHAHHAK